MIEGGELNSKPEYQRGTSLACVLTMGSTYDICRRSVDEVEATRSHRLDLQRVSYSCYRSS
jgi:hypothetical protein